jgi:type I restriction enzyme, S subunit
VVTRPEWTVSTLGRCLTGAPSYGINAAAVPHSPSLPTYLRITDIDEDGRLGGDVRVSVAAPGSHAYFLSDGDVVFARTGASVGKSYSYRLTDGGLVFAGFLIKVHPDPTVLLPEFLAQYVRSHSYWEWVRATSMRSGQPGINGREYAAMPLCLPPMKEQEAIAEALRDADAAIEALDALIAKKRDVKQATMQQLLTGRSRLPGFSGGWSAAPLGTLAKMRSGGTPPTSVGGYYGGDIAWASISDMSSSGKYLSSTERTITEAGLVNSPAVVFPRGVLLYAMYASIGECCVSTTPMATSQAILGVECSRRLDVEFLYYMMQFRRAEIARSGQQGTQANLNAQMVRDTVVALPPVDEQEAITGVLSDMDSELDALVAERDKMRLVKQGMMQELLSGRVRLV